MVQRHEGRRDEPKQSRARQSPEARIAGLQGVLASFRICAVTCLAAVGTAIGLMLGTSDEALLRDASASLTNYGFSVRLGVAYQLLPVILLVLLVYWLSTVYRLYHRINLVSASLERNNPRRFEEVKESLPAGLLPVSRLICEAKTESRADAFARKALVLFITVFAFVTPSFLLLALQIRFLPYQSVSTTYSHQVVVGTASVLASTILWLIVWRGSPQRRREDSLYCYVARSKTSALVGLTLLLLTTVFSWFEAVIPSRTEQAEQVRWDINQANRRWELELLRRGQDDKGEDKQNDMYCYLAARSDDQERPNLCVKPEEPETNVGLMRGTLYLAYRAFSFYLAPVLSGANAVDRWLCPLKWACRYLRFTDKPLMADPGSAPVSKDAGFPAPELITVSRSSIGIVLNQRMLRFADFSGAVLYGARFASADLTGASFEGATVSAAVFWHARLRGADFDGATATYTEFGNADARLATFFGARLVDAKFARADLRGARFVNARIFSSDFEQAQLVGASFDSPVFSQQGDSSTEIVSSSFRGACLQMSSFLGTKPFLSDFTDAALERALVSERPVVIRAKDALSDQLKRVSQQAYDTALGRCNEASPSSEAEKDTGGAEKELCVLRDVLAVNGVPDETTEVIVLNAARKVATQQQIEPWYGEQRVEPLVRSPSEITWSNLLPRDTADNRPPAKLATSSGLAQQICRNDDLTREMICGHMRQLQAHLASVETSDKAGRCLRPRPPGLVTQAIIARLRTIESALETSMDGLPSLTTVTESAFPCRTRNELSDYKTMNCRLKDSAEASRSAIQTFLREASDYVAPARRLPNCKPVPQPPPELCPAP